MVGYIGRLLGSSLKHERPEVGDVGNNLLALLVEVLAQLRLLAHDFDLDILELALKVLEQLIKDHCFLCFVCHCVGLC